MTYFFETKGIAFNKFASIQRNIYQDHPRRTAYSRVAKRTYGANWNLMTSKHIEILQGSALKRKNLQG